MSPDVAAEGRKLLAAYDAGGLQRGAGDRGWTALRNDLRIWLWTHREELIRCAELATEEIELTTEEWSAVKSALRGKTRGECPT